MAKRYQVFVSSTYADLKEERQAVISALLELGAIPAGMELFPAADDTAWKLIQKVIQECDYYLLVMAGKYGSVDGNGVSYTELEYDYAQSLGKPVMAFLHSDPEGLPQNRCEKTELAQTRLTAFAGKVKAAKHVKFWKGSEHLAGQVALSFAHFLSNYPATGWVRADEVDSPETLAELNQLRKQVIGLEAALSRAEQTPPEGSEALSQGEDWAPATVVVTFRMDGIPADAKAAPTQTKPYDPELTWDDILSTIGVKLFGECSETTLKRHLLDSILDGHRSTMNEEFREWVASNGVEASGLRFRDHRLRMSDDDFGTLITQLMALGYIVRSERTHSVSDRDTYWTLTPLGESRVIVLRAIQREPEEADSDAESEEASGAPSPPVREKKS